jgi:hypothetical protein
MNQDICFRMGAVLAARSGARKRDARIRIWFLFGRFWMNLCAVMKIGGFL